MHPAHHPLHKVQSSSSPFLDPDPDPLAWLCLLLQDLHHGRIQMKTLTNKWYEEVRQGPSGSEDDEQELL